VVAVLLVLVANGGWIATRSVYFVGTDDDGFVTLYSGLPYALPGLDLFSTEFTSGVPAQTLAPRVQKTVTEHKLRSHDDAVDLIRQLERGDIAGQSAQ
jgi:PPM family protein phosphatase